MMHGRLIEVLLIVAVSAALFLSLGPVIYENFIYCSSNICDQPPVFSPWLLVVLAIAAVLGFVIYLITWDEEAR